MHVTSKLVWASMLTMATSALGAALLIGPNTVKSGRSAPADRDSEPQGLSVHSSQRHDDPDQVYAVPPEVQRDLPAPRAVLDARKREPAKTFAVGPFVSVQVNVDNGGNNILDDAANEPSMTIDPTDPTKIAIGWRQFDSVFSDFRQAGVAYSTDSGQTWTFPGVIQPGQFRSDPVLGSDGAGNFIYSSLSSLNSIETFKSIDGGVTWSPPTGTPTFGGDKQWMIVDDRAAGMGAGHIYQNWNVQFTCCPPNDFTRSIDANASYQGPFQIPLPSMKWGTLDTDSDGTLYLAGATLDQSSHLFARSGNAKDPGLNPTFDFVNPINLGGQTGGFGGFAGPNPDGLLGQVWVATDPNKPGRVYVLGSVAAGGPSLTDVHFIRSENGGGSWTAPVTVNDTTGGGSYNWFGAMSVAPNGRIDVTWNFTFIPPSFSAVFYSASVDHGQTWSSAILVSPAFDSHVGFPQQNKMGDYSHMISDNGGANLAYAATFNNEQDVWFLRIPADCNNNGTPDDEDVLVGGLPDCNDNLIPDSCEPNQDCNGNLIQDVCDIFSGFSQDCDGNLVPDTCDPQDDCNNNSIQDICEIADGSVGDCNNNGTLDDCDIAGATSNDDNHDGIPDECSSATGACCLAGVPSCLVSTRTGCDDLGGAYQGDNKPCLGDVDANNVDDRCELPEIKFSQPPTGEGEDIASNLDWSDFDPNNVVADDFISDGRPIDGVRWWGSNLGPTQSSVVAAGPGVAIDVSYRWDDGQATNSIGDGGVTLGWANLFRNNTGAPITLTEIQVAFGQVGGSANVSLGDAVDACVWVDPTASGDMFLAAFFNEPAFLVRRWSLPGGVHANDGQTLATHSIPGAPIVIMPGWDFYVGLGDIQTDLDGLARFPAALDQTEPQGRSWYFDGLTPFTPENLLAQNVDLIDNAGFPGNWMIRVNATGTIPAPCDLYGSNPANPVSNIYAIQTNGGPDAIIASPGIVALSGLANVDTHLIGTTGFAGGGGGRIFTLGFDGSVISSRPSTDPTITAIAGVEMAPPAAAAHGFIPGHVYASVATTVSPNPMDRLYDLGLFGMGPDTLVGIYPPAGVAGAIDGLAFDPVTGLLYGGELFINGQYHLMQISSAAGLTDLGDLPGSWTPAGMGFANGNLYASTGGGGGELWNIQIGNPSTSFLDHDVAPGSLAGLTHCPPVQEQTEIDGWLVSFHEPEDANAANAIAQGPTPVPPLGLYFCDADIVVQAQVNLATCDDERVREYNALLADCCLIHSIADSRSGQTPAQPGVFLEEECLDYDIGIQAVVGVKFVDNAGVCEEVATGRFADADFWGWHSSDFGLGAAFGLHQAIETVLSMVGLDWLYGPWVDVSAVCSQPNMSFELLTNTAGGDPDVNDDAIPDVCEGLPPGVGDDICFGGANYGGSCSTDADCPGGVCGLKSRYVTLTTLLFASRGLPADRTIQVTIASMPQFPARVGETWWAGPSQSIDNTPNPSLTGAQLVCEPTPSHAEVWPGGYLHLFGAPIVPGSSFNVRLCDSIGLNCSDPLLVATGKWGDIVQPFGGGLQPSFGDINAAISRFQTNPAAPDVTRADLRGSGSPGAPNVPDRTVNFLDINLDVAAFQNEAYPFTVPACP